MNEWKINSKGSWMILSDQRLNTDHLEIQSTVIVFWRVVGECKATTNHYQMTYSHVAFGLIRPLIVRHSGHSWEWETLVEKCGILPSSGFFFLILEKPQIPLKRLFRYYLLFSSHPQPSVLILAIFFLLLCCLSIFPIWTLRGSLLFRTLPVHCGIVGRVTDCGNLLYKTTNHVQTK